MNTPDPLRCAPAPLLAAEGWQMSFGERAALEGLLSQLEPMVSIEIGTATGGSLRCLSRHSTIVHAFDLRPPPDAVPRNVRFHAGDSRFTLGRVLAELDAPVGFALIDGDHTSDGVHADALTLLDSPACARCVIVAHDTANPAVRAGLEGLHEHPAVVYWEPAFLPGYVFARGSFAGASWGGFGLLVTGDRSTDGYGSDPVQSLYR